MTRCKKALPTLLISFLSAYIRVQKVFSMSFVLPILLIRFLSSCLLDTTGECIFHVLCAPNFARQVSFFVPTGYDWRMYFPCPMCSQFCSSGFFLRAYWIRLENVFSMSYVLPILLVRFLSSCLLDTSAEGIFHVLCAPNFARQVSFFVPATGECLHG